MFQLNSETSLCSDHLWAWVIKRISLRPCQSETCPAFSFNDKTCGSIVLMDSRATLPSVATIGGSISSKVRFK